MFHKTYRRLVCLSLLGLTATSPVSAEVASSEIKIRGIVPTICHVHFSNNLAQTRNNELDLGTMTQLCNDASGYRVILRTPMNVSNATLVFGGRRVPLSATGETVIVDTDAPDWSVDHAKIELSEGDSLPDNFFLRIQAEPKGTIY